ncbi:LOW QUALITY PROTEIN: hypothetical protein L198_07883 [Cryptococcus wingfieldii CBS 7118]|uniref:Uncharacterized protein n=1 Tax=Cryptococcus wingfieldii CBS 7118 TaxID=1295528 RepID=A0A1E3HUQ4_9TREE|nr:LOW QUALITY PROTEIN: hypothetical protein L198_07883 [Cryptococcus wingfieldii CBS 7118]ODN80073.1 LOW QUALITY PROTEIN: hypothetical protein L198_07883 [Cryptococcus wingfieldii CBS 7118]
MPTSADDDAPSAQAIPPPPPSRPRTPVHFPHAPIGTPPPTPTTPLTHLSLSRKKNPSRQSSVSHAPIHTASDIELGLQTYNRIAPPITTATATNANANAKGQRKAPRWVAYVAASVFMGGGGVVVGSVVRLVYYMTKHRDVRSWTWGR